MLTDADSQFNRTLDPLDPPPIWLEGGPSIRPDPSPVYPPAVPVVYTYNQPTVVSITDRDPTALSCTSILRITLSLAHPLARISQYALFLTFGRMTAAVIPLVAARYPSLVPRLRFAVGSWRSFWGTQHPLCIVYSRRCNLGTSPSRPHLCVCVFFFPAQRACVHTPAFPFVRSAVPRSSERGPFLVCGVPWTSGDAVTSTRLRLLSRSRIFLVAFFVPSAHPFSLAAVRGKLRPLPWANSQVSRIGSRGRLRCRPALRPSSPSCPFVATLSHRFQRGRAGSACAV